MDLIHELDYCTWLFGMPDQATSIKRSVSSLQINATDFTHYNLLYSEFTATISLNYFRRKPKRVMEILFTDETWTVDLLKGSVTSDENKIIFETSFDMKETYQKQLTYFINCLEENKVPMNPISDGIEVLKLCLQK